MPPSPDYLKGRAEALEEAAEWHDARADEYDAQYKSKRGRVLPIIINAAAHRASARAIRALKETPR